MENEVKKIIGTVGKLLPMQTKMSPSAAREILQNYINGDAVWWSGTDNDAEVTQFKL